MEESSSGQSRCRQVLPVTLAIQAGVTVAKCRWGRLKSATFDKYYSLHLENGTRQTVSAGFTTVASTAGLAESNGSLLPGLWYDSLHVTCGLTACTPGSALGSTLGNKYGKTLPFYLLLSSLNIFHSFITLLLKKNFVACKLTNLFNSTSDLKRIFINVFITFQSLEYSVASLSSLLVLGVC